MQVPLSVDEGTCYFSEYKDNRDRFYHVCTNAANYKKQKNECSEGKP